ncbi:kinase-like domain-containing protein [Paraphoma chrysanthemicola]|uniref:non-specific serine/threonine protein kinase n=1 Tax=Paraphoma chrysanthemicola TaxID=798071 RepID=A0A8K0W376_9PLEO|nr:kinase-like domain-containing protein [Paraphoma chrysanthemicola]
MSRTRSQKTEDALQEVFQRSDKAEVFTDLEIDEVSRILHDSQLPGGDCPRTYIVLRTIGQLDLLDTFIKLGFDDQWFPVGPRNLPSSLSPAIRNEFANAQSVILTKSLDVEHGRHRHFTHGELLPFEISNRLGSGGYSQVDRIHSRISKRSYALKRIRRRNVFGNDTKEAMKRFKSEVDIMRGLQHRHIVQFVGSYTDKTYLGIITSPVADMDLSAFLTRLCGLISTGSTPGKAVASEMSSSLRSFFGCLAAALAYLHDNRVRHKDIKPQNILVWQGTVLFTDFGLSRNFADSQGSTTSGPTPATPRYSPPEVAAYEQRNTSADVWSLGCVYLEMLAALQGHDIDWIKDYLSINGTQEPYYRSNPPACQLLFSNYEANLVKSDRIAVNWVRHMIVTDRSTRWTAAYVVQQIRSCDNLDTGNMFCGICCRGDEESDSHDSLDDQPYQMASVKSRFETLTMGPDRISNASKARDRNPDVQSNTTVKAPSVVKLRRPTAADIKSSAARKEDSYQAQRNAPRGGAARAAKYLRSFNIAELRARTSSSTIAGQGLQSTRFAPAPQTNEDRSSPGKGKVNSPVQISSQNHATSPADGISAAQSETSGPCNVAFAVFRYKSQARNEIDLIPGEVITDVVQNESGWTYGHKRNGDKGWVPSAYVTMQISGESLASEVPKHVNNHGLKQSYIQGTQHKSKNAARPQDGLRNVWSAAMDPQRKKGGDSAPLASPKPAISHLPEAVALYSYEAGEDNEISFPEGARIVNLKFPDDDWWYGEYEGKQGLFPKNFVELQ